MSESVDPSLDEARQVAHQFGVILEQRARVVTCSGENGDQRPHFGSPNLSHEPSTSRPTSERNKIEGINLASIQAKIKQIGVPLMAVGSFYEDGAEMEALNKNVIFSMEVGDMETCLASECIFQTSQNLVSTALSALRRNVKAVLIKSNVAHTLEGKSMEFSTFHFVAAMRKLLGMNFRLEYRHEESRRLKERERAIKQGIQDFVPIPRLSSLKAELAPNYFYEIDPFHALTPRQVWVEVSVHEKDFPADASADQIHDQAWHWWSDMEKYVSSNPKLAVCLKIGSVFPEDLKRSQRWLAERLRAIILPADVWRKNKAKFPILPASVKDFIVRSFHIPHITYLIEDGSSRQLEQFQYLLHLYREYLNSQLDPFRQKAMRHLADAPIRPLQPLRDHLTQEIYSVFEGDPIKYKIYHDACYAALVDLRDAGRGVARADPIVTMVVGAGRGPLVTQFIKAADALGMFFRIYALDKNPIAISAMTAKLDSHHGEWRRHASFIYIVHCDMRSYNPKEQADLLISELLGSFGCNELSPECLDAAQLFLKPTGLSIPSAYTNYLQPVMAMSLHQDLKTFAPKQRKFLNEFVLVDMRSVVAIAPYQEAFTFRHPNFEPHSNERDVELTFEADNDYCLTGFAGYFLLNLLKDISLNILPDRQTVGLTSWFPAFFGLARPVDVKRGDKIVLRMGRRVSPENRRVWYEWALLAPEVLPLQNVLPDYWLSL